jgi:hypothetical protein
MKALPVGGAFFLFTTEDAEDTEGREDIERV